MLEELAAAEMLPARIHLCGGGSRLPEVRAAPESDRFWKRLPFARPPQVEVMTPGDIEAITDATDLLVDQQDVTPLGLAFQAHRTADDRRSADAALKRVLRAIKV